MPVAKYINKSFAETAFEHRRAGTPLDAIVARIVSSARANPNDRTLAIAARCIQCKQTAAGVRGCKDGSCSLHKLRPFQMDAVPAGTRHVRHCTNDIEQPAGLDPSEPEETDDG